MGHIVLDRVGHHSWSNRGRYAQRRDAQEHGLLKPSETSECTATRLDHDSFAQINPVLVCRHRRELIHRILFVYIHSRCRLVHNFRLLANISPIRLLLQE